VQIAIETGVGRSAIVNFHSFVCDHCYYLCATSEISLYTDRLNSREIDSRACTKLAIVANSRMSHRWYSSIIILRVMRMLRSFFPTWRRRGFFVRLIKLLSLGHSQSSTRK
jgi:hypothetical protein